MTQPQTISQGTTSPHHQNLTHPSPKLLPKIRGHLLDKNKSINFLPPSVQISILGPDKLTPSNDLVTDPEHDEENDTDVSDEEFLRAPWHEGRKALRQDDEDVEEKTVV